MSAVRQVAKAGKASTELATASAKQASKFSALATGISNAAKATTSRISRLTRYSKKGANDVGGGASTTARGANDVADSGTSIVKKANGANNAAKKGTKKTLTQKAKKVAKYTAGATLVGTAAYSGIDAAASGKNFNETFEKNLSTVVGGGAKTLKNVGSAVATPVVSGVAGGLSEGLGISGLFSGLNSSMLMMIAGIFVLYMIMSGDSQQST